MFIVNATDPDIELDELIFHKPNSTTLCRSDFLLLIRIASGIVFRARRISVYSGAPFSPRGIRTIGAILPGAYKHRAAACCHGRGWRNAERAEQARFKSEYIAGLAEK